MASRGFGHSEGPVLGGLSGPWCTVAPSVSQLADEEGKYLGPAKETCISPPELQNNNSLLLLPCASASQNSSNYHTSLHSSEDLIVPGQLGHSPTDKRENGR